MEVRAADFFSDRPPQRVGGTEFEYNIQSPHEVHESVLLRGQIVSAAFSAAPGIPALAYTRIDKAFILQNGGQLARDVRHTEYDSPEGRGPYEITAGDVAGIPIMQRLAAAGSTAHKGVYRRTGSNLSGVTGEDPSGKRNTFTNGYHANYLIPAVIARSLSRSPLLPTHLATAWWSFAGMVGPNGYQLSQKVQEIGGDPIETVQSQRRTGTSKPMATIMVGTQDFDVNPDPQWTRVEVRYADGGQSRWARFVWHGMMSAILRLHEHADKLPFDEEGLRLADPVRVAKEVATDLQVCKTYETADGKRMTAPDIQEELGMRILKLSELVELPHGELRAVRELLEANQELGNVSPQDFDYGNLADAVDWIAKLHVLRTLNIDPVRDAARAAEFDLKWDRIFPKGIGEMWWKQVKGRQAIIPDSLINSAMYNPPQHTRAAIRGEAVRGGYLGDGHWGYMVTTDGGRFKLRNPYQHEIKRSQA